MDIRCSGLPLNAVSLSRLMVSVPGETCPSDGREKATIKAADSDSESRADRLSAAVARYLPSAPATAVLLIVDLPPALRAEAHGIQTVLVVATYAVVLVSVAVRPRIGLAVVVRLQPLLFLICRGVGLPTKPARRESTVRVVRSVFICSDIPQ